MNESIKPYPIEGTVIAKGVLQDPSRLTYEMSLALPVTLAGSAVFRENGMSLKTLEGTLPPDDGTNIFSLDNGISGCVWIAILTAGIGGLLYLERRRKKGGNPSDGVSSLTGTPHIRSENKRQTGESSSGVRNSWPPKKPHYRGSGKGERTGKAIIIKRDPYTDEIIGFQNPDEL